VHSFEVTEREPIVSLPGCQRLFPKKNSTEIFQPKRIDFIVIYFFLIANKYLSVVTLICEDA
jgi:hypothetical protein